MKDSISIIFAAIIGTFLIVIMPLYSILDRQDSMSYNVVLTQTTKFVDDIRNNGFLTRQAYIDYIYALSSTSNTYKVTIEAYKKTLIRDTYENGNIIKDSFVEEVELYNTNDILDVLEAETIDEKATSLGKNNTYLFDENDEIYVRVYNTNITSGSIIYDLFTGGINNDNKVINVSYGGVVNKVNWELYNKIKIETAKVPEVIFTVPVNNSDSTNIKKITNLGEVIDIEHTSTGEDYTYLYNLELPENQTIKTSVELHRFSSINAGLNSDGSERYINLSDLTESNFESIKSNIINRFIELNGMYADIDLQYRQKGDYYVFDIILTNVRMAALDYISNVASISILSGLGRDENDILSLGGESVKLELVNKELAHSLVISNPYNWKEMLKTSLREAIITDGRVYANQEIAFVISYTGIDMDKKTETDVVNAIRTGLKIYDESIQRSNVEIYTMAEMTERFGNLVAQELNATSYSNHIIIKFTYELPNILTKNYIELEDGWIDTGIDWSNSGYDEDELVILATGSKSGEYYILNDDEPPIAPAIVFDGTLGTNGWYTSDVELKVVSSKVDTIKQKDLQMTSTGDRVVVGGSGLFRNTVQITGATILSETELQNYLLTTQGTSNVVGYAYDYVGNSTKTVPYQVKIDKTAPTTPKITLSGNQGTNGWFVGDVTVTITPGTDSVSGVLKTTYSVDGADKRNETTGTQFRITKDGRSKVTVTTYDNAGNKSIETIDVNLDKSQPLDAKIEVISGDKNLPTNDWYKSDVQVRITISDEEKTVSGIGNAYYSISGGSTVAKTALEEKTMVINITSNGVHNLVVYTYTKAGNVKETKFTVKIDKNAPNEPTINLLGVIGTNDWYTDFVRATIKSNNDIGPSLENFMSYTISKSGTTSDEVIIENNGQIIIQDEGEHVLTVYSRDNAGNKATIQKNIKIDTTPPTSANFIIQGTKGKDEWYISDVLISHDDGLDSTSGIASVELSTDSITSSTNGLEVQMVTRDNAGHSVTTSTLIKVDKEAPTGLVIELDEPTSSEIFGVNMYNKEVNVKIIPAVDFVEGIDTVDRTTYAIYQTINGTTQIVLEEQEYQTEFKISDDGKYSIVARTYDKAGNVREVSKVVWIDKSETQAPKIASVNGTNYLNSTLVNVTDNLGTVQIGLQNVEIGNTIQITVIDEQYNIQETNAVVTDSYMININLDKKGKYTIVLRQKNMYGTTSTSSSSMTYDYE